MLPKAIQQKIAYLEFVNDQLLSEITHADYILKSLGIPEGLATVKQVIKEEFFQEEEE